MKLTPKTLFRNFDTTIAKRQDGLLAPTRYLVATNHVDVFHYVELEPGRQCATGQPFLEEFPSKAAAFAAYPQAERHLRNAVENTLQDSIDIY